MKVIIHFIKLYKNRLNDTFFKKNFVSKRPHFPV